MNNLLKDFHYLMVGIQYAVTPQPSPRLTREPEYTWPNCKEVSCISKKYILKNKRQRIGRQVLNKGFTCAMELARRAIVPTTFTIK